MPPIILTAQEQEALVGLHDNFNSHIKFIADRTYLQKMEKTANSENEDNFANRQFKELLDGKKTFIKPQRDGGLVRGIHGLRHAMRVAIYTEMLHKFRSTKIVGKNEQPDKFPERAVVQVAKFFDITSADVLMLTKFAAFFHDSARENEAKDEWDHRSAENCYDFLVQQGVNKEVARFFANAARYKSDYQKFNAYLSDTLGVVTSSDQGNFNYIRQLIAYSDTLDIMRCHSPVKGYYLDKFFRVQDSPSNREAANQLMLTVQQLLAAEGDLPAESEIKISEQPCITLPILKQGDIKLEWDESTKLDFEFSEDPYSFMQNYINNYIDRNKLQALPKTEPFAAAGLNITNQSLITECNWQEIFGNNKQFGFIKINNQLDQIGHIVTQKQPSQHIINIKKDSIEFPRSGDNDSLSEDQILATTVILQNLIVQGGHDATNPLMIEPNQAFTVKMMVTLMEHVKKANIAVAFTASADTSPEMREIIEKHNNEINWHPNKKHKKSP